MLLLPTTADQNRGFERTAELVTALLSTSPVARAAARALQAATTWREAVGAITTLPQLAGYFGGQALCGLYLCFVQRDDMPEKQFRSRLMTALDPESLREYACAGPGPKASLRRIFGAATAGKTEEKLAWIATNAAALFQWAGVDFHWLADESTGAAVRPLTAVDIEHSLCYFSRLETARERLGPAAKPLHDALSAVTGGHHGKLRVPLKQLGNWDAGKVRAVLADMSVSLGGRGPRIRSRSLRRRWRRRRSGGGRRGGGTLRGSARAGGGAGSFC